MAEENPIGIAEMQRLYSGNQGVDLRTGDIALRIGQTSEIDENKVVSLMNNLSTIKGMKDRFVADRDEIEKILAETNSNAFYNGEEAQTNRQRMQEVEQDLEILTTKIDEMSNMISIIKEYNECVRKIKAAQKLQLLIAISDKINEEAEGCRATYQYREESRKESTNYQRGFSAGGGDLTGTFITSEAKTDDSGNTEYVNTIHYVAYINYWGLIPWGKGKGPGNILEFWRWGDDDENKLASKLRTVESRLQISIMPY